MPAATCYVTLLSNLACHIEVRKLPNRAEPFRAIPWVQDRFLMRAVLDATDWHPQFAAGDEEAAITTAMEFLERRFGPAQTKPVPCRIPTAHHVHVNRIPLKWTDDLRSALR